MRAADMQLDKKKEEFRKAVQDINNKQYIIELDETKTRVVEKFRRGELIGQGGFAIVYSLISEETGKKYAGKIVPKSIVASQRYKEKLESEIRIHLSLDHPHICKMYKHFEDSLYHYMILEYCANNSLSQLVKRRGFLTEPEAQYFLIQIIDGVKYLHKQNVIHRDLKLGNILLDENLEVKIGDLGLAVKLYDADERRKTRCGTPTYIAPEIVDKYSSGYSFEVDIWSVGIIAYHLLIGKGPFEGRTPEEVYSKIKAMDYSFPVYDHNTSHQARMFIRSILTENPGDRLTLDEMLEHPFFTDCPIPPPKSLPLSVFQKPYYLTARATSMPTPIANRTREAPTEDKNEGVSKRVKMTDVGKPLVTKPVPPLNTAVIPGGSAMNRNVYVHTNYDADGNGKNNMNRFSLQSTQSQGMEARLDTLNRSFHEQRGLLPQETFEGLPAGIVPSITVARERYEIKTGASLLYAHAANLHTAMHHPSLIKQNSHFVPTRTKNWIVDEYDYTKKYGIGYMFSNGNTGLLFNDRSSIIVNADGTYYEYHPRVSIKQWNFNQEYPPSHSGYINDYPPELSKKITLIKYFRSNFLDRAQSRPITKEEVDDKTRGGPNRNMPFVVKWLFKDEGSICLLSTGAILVRFEGGTILNLESPFDDITFLDKYGLVSAMTLPKAITKGRDDIDRRLQYITHNITDIVKQVSHI